MPTQTGVCNWIGSGFGSLTQTPKTPRKVCLFTSESCIGLINRYTLVLPYTVLFLKNQN